MIISRAVPLMHCSFGERMALSYALMSLALTYLSMSLIIISWSNNHDGSV